MTAPRQAEPAGASRPVTPVALAIILRGGEVLVGRRAPGGSLGGLWEFPGGKIRPGERADAAASRELAEETGLRIPPERFEPLTFVHHDYGQTRVLLIAWLARAVELAEEPAAEGAGAGGGAGDAKVAGAGGPEGSPGGRVFRWIPVAELDRIEMPAANAAIVGKLRIIARSKGET